ncbi:hypothetical protein PTTW11_04392 [Pyrenophora teres f. teres]|uniref:Uncharacterized protein n=1 Tax=Pyrenophora teres f. teres TaxID=97479 RepID=A0A6S6VZ35_9PLEO|nr:hypothetical protein PTTW11_04392 [Pyrenophora teres f. teres]
MNSLQELEALEPRLHRLGENSQRKRERINELRLQIRRATKSARKLQSECNNHVIYYSRSQCRHLADLMQHKLPAELRDMIYEHLVVEDRPIYVGPYYHIRTYDGPNLDPPLPDEESDDVTRTVGSHVGPRITWASVLERRRLENPEADILDESETEDVDNDGVNPEIIERIRKLDLSCSNERSNHNEGKMILPDGRVKQVHTYHPPEDMVLPNSYLLNPRYVGPVMSAEIQKVYYTQNTFSICSVRQAIRNFGTLHSGYFMQTWEEEGKPRKVPDDLKLQPLRSYLLTIAPYTNIYTRTLVIALKSPPISKNTSQVSALTGVYPRTVDRIYSRAIAAGFEPNELPIKILPHYVQDALKPSRPAKQVEEVKEQIFQQWAQSLKSRNLCLYRLEGVESSRIQEDQANEEA